MSGVCPDPTRSGCLKTNPKPGANFCSACGATAASLGVPGSAPMAPPATPRVAATSVLRDGLVGDLSAVRDTREQVSLQSGLMAAAGVLIGFAASALVFDVGFGGDELNSFGGFFVGLLAIVGLWFAASRLPRHFITAASTAALFVVPITVLALFAESFEDEANIGLPLIFTGGVLAALWFFPGLRARPALLGFALLHTSLGLITFIGTERFADRLEYFIEYQELDALTEFSSEIAIFSLLIGVGLLVSAYVLDRRRWPNVATPFVAVGLALTLLAASALRTDPSVGTSVLVVLVAAGTFVLGAITGRRAVTWIGTGLITIGLIVLATFMTGEGSTAIEFAVFALLIGGAVGAAAHFTAPKLAEKLPR